MDAFLCKVASAIDTKPKASLVKLVKARVSATMLNESLIPHIDLLPLSVKRKRELKKLVSEVITQKIKPFKIQLSETCIEIAKVNSPNIKIKKGKKVYLCIMNIDGLNELAELIVQLEKDGYPRISELIYHRLNQKTNQLPEILRNKKMRFFV